MGKQKKHGAKKYEEYYGKIYIPSARSMTKYYDNPFKRKDQKINALLKNFGPYEKCPKCGSFLKVDSEGKSGERQITVKVECSKCGFREYGLKIDY